MAAAANAPFTSSTETARSSSNTASVREALSRGTRTAWPLSLPWSSGKIRPIALADPVVVGIRLWLQERARLRSLLKPSTTSWVPVTSWRVVIEPCLMPKLSCTTFTTGARQLVVQLAAVTRRCLEGS